MTPPIDRHALSSLLLALPAAPPADLRKTGAAVIKAALTTGREAISQSLRAHPADGMRIAAAYSALTDAIVATVHDFTCTRLYPSANRTTGERLSIVAIGGYGRAEMALHSDVDVLFLTPSRRNAWAEARIEAMLYLLWDLGLKLGQQSASVDEMLRLATADMQVRTALLEARLVTGDAAPFDDLAARFVTLQAGSVPAFVTAKLAERNERHIARGDSRYVVEPDVKDGKGALRDLHTLLWIGKYAYRVRRAPELVAVGLLTPAELRQFGRAERFFWSVRCHLHDLAGRAEERLGFDAQREIAARMNYADRPGKSAVERFMQFYFRQAKAVGDLSGVFLAQLDEDFAPKGSRFGLPALFALVKRTPKIEGFVMDRGRIAVPEDGFFATDPVRLLQLFALADVHGVEIHPRTMRLAARDARLIDAAVRNDPRANAVFLDVLTSPRDPEAPLRWMNEAGVLGRFIPDFGRIVAQMQFDMYHHYTVDEHTIHMLGLVSRIERGLLRDDHPLATKLIRQIASRRALYVAVLLHDIAKGRGGDHSELGAQVAMRLCPRLGLSRSETDTVAWLVRHHLLISRTAFKRDLADPKTIADFAAIVQSPERLRLLLILTVVDIRAVGPTSWSGWKRELIRTLYDAAEEMLRLGHKQRGREEIVAANRAALDAAFGWDEAERTARVGMLPDAWWIAESAEVRILNTRHLIAAAEDRRATTIFSSVDAERSATLISIVALDRPGLFHSIVSAISAAGGNIIDARVYTGSDARALDNILVQKLDGTPFDDPELLKRMQRGIREAVDGRIDPCTRLATRPARIAAARIEAAALIDNKASNRFTVVEVNAEDRPALLSDLAAALLRADVAIHSAHIATYGERAVDVFYLTDRSGAKIVDTDRAKSLSRALEEAARI